jgi:hypothetical protein
MSYKVTKTSTAPASVSEKFQTFKDLEESDGAESPVINDVDDILPLQPCNFFNSCNC